MSLYEYKAALIRVVDGDTVDLRVDLGFSIYKEDRFRLAGINTPELHAKDPAERERAQQAKAKLEALLQAPTLVVKTRKDSQEKFGRYLATILVGELDVVAELIRLGHGVPYEGGAR
jgi:micrococcal nuclease